MLLAFSDISLRQGPQLHNRYSIFGNACGQKHTTSYPEKASNIKLVNNRFKRTLQEAGRILNAMNDELAQCWYTFHQTVRLLCHDHGTANWCWAEYLSLHLRYYRNDGSIQNYSTTQSTSIILITDHILIVKFTNLWGIAAWDDGKLSKTSPLAALAPSQVLHVFSGGLNIEGDTSFCPQCPLDWFLHFGYHCFETLEVFYAPFTQSTH